MATPVEQATYHIPGPDDYGHYLSSSYSFRRDVTKGGYGKNPRRYENFPLLAQEIGLRRDNDVPTRHGTWHIYEGIDLAIPNFPDGNTRVNEALALYERDGNLTNAILRLQPGRVQEPFTVEDLANDLEAFTKYYVERPGLVGFPSKALTEGKNHWIVCFGGMPLGAVVGWMANFYPDTWQYSSEFASAVLGAYAGPITATITAIIWGLSEKRARGKIPHKDEYMRSDNAAEVLAGQKEHIVQTSIQRELYSALQQRGTTLTPDQFLNDIYAQMPFILVNERKKEIERAKYSEEYTNGLIDEALPKMVGVAQILQPAA